LKMLNTVNSLWQPLTPWQWVCQWKKITLFIFSLLLMDLARLN
jgi:hypothetical protein